MIVNLIKNKLNSPVGKDVVWTFSVQILIMLCSFAINKILSNRLTIDNFGQFNVIKRSVSVMSFVMLAGTGIALPRYISLYKGKGSVLKTHSFLVAAVAYILSVTMVMALLCALFSAYAQEIMTGNTGEPLLFAVSIAYSFALALSGFIFAYYRGVGDFKKFNVSQLLIQLSIIVPLLTIPHITTGDVFVSWLAITSLLVAIFVFGEQTKKRFILFKRVRTANVRKQFLILVKYSGWRLLGDFFLFSLSAFPVVYLSYYHDLQSVAYFSIGITFVTMATPIFSFMGFILLPYVSKGIATGKMAQANGFIRRLALIYIASSALITAVFYGFVQFLIRLFFAENYVVADGLTRILILSILPQAMYLLYRNPIDAVSVTPYNTIILGFSFFLMVVLFYHYHTLKQYACAYLVVSAVQGILSYLAWKTLQIKQKKHQND